MKYIDIKPESTDSLVEWRKWKNNFKSQCISILGKKVPVGYEPDCAGFGSRYCKEQGEHSWFNHSMDAFYTSNLSNLPEGYTEQ